MDKFIKCKECGKTTKKTGGRQLYCVDCKKIIGNRRTRITYNKYKDKYQKKAVEHYHNNKDYYKKQNKKYSQTPIKKYYIYKNSAKKRNIKFSLTFEDFKTYWRKPCFYCGENIKSIGIDRVNNKKGYENNNLVPCCSICNSIKSKLNKLEFLDHIKRIINHVIK